MAKCRRRCVKQSSGISVGMILVFGVAIVTEWIAHGKYETNMLNIMSRHRKELKCFECSTSNGTKVPQRMGMECVQIKRDCRLLGWKIEKFLPTSPRCLRNQTFVDAVLKLVNERYVKYKNSLSSKVRRERMGGRMQELVTDAVGAFYRSSRNMVQSHPTDELRDNHGWRTMSGYIRTKIFSILLGPEGSFRNESLMILEDGLYEIHAKLTFECIGANRKHENIHMEVLQKSDGSRVILQGLERGKCDTAGDLATIYLSGMFYMESGDAIVLRYKSSENVRRSMNGKYTYKSYLGIVRLRSFRH